MKIISVTPLEGTIEDISVQKPGTSTTTEKSLSEIRDPKLPPLMDGGKNNDLVVVRQT